MTHYFLVTIFASILVICTVARDNISAGYYTLNEFGRERAVAAKENTNGSCGENVTWSFDSTTGLFTISGTGNMFQVLINVK